MCDKQDILDSIAEAFYTDPEYFSDLVLKQGRGEDAISIIAAMIGIEREDTREEA